MKTRDVALGLVTAVLVAGCSTHYIPRSPGRVSIVMQGGSIAYQRGDHVYKDFLGSGLVDAVGDDPQAKDAAETFFDRNVGGLVATGVGVACLVGGVTVLAVDQPPSSGRQTLGIGALLCGLAGEITGLVLLTTAQPYQFDALNIYNDHAEQRMLTPRYAYPPPGYYPAPSAPPPGGAPPPSPPGAAPPDSATPPAAAPPAPPEAPSAAPAPAPGS